MNHLSINLMFTPFPVLTTARLRLRNVDQSDVHEIFFLRSDPEMMRYLDKTPVKTLMEATQHIQKLNNLEKANEAITWAITWKEHEQLIGTICFWNIHPEHYRAEIGYALHSAEQGKGIMQEALRAVLDYGFKVMHLHSVEANVNPDNLASVKLLERNGFHREAYFRENYFYDGRFLDSAIYSILAPV